MFHGYVSERPFDFLPSDLFHELIWQVWRICKRYGAFYAAHRMLEQVAGPRVHKLPWFGDETEDEELLEKVLGNFEVDGPIIKCINLAELDVSSYTGITPEFKIALTKLNKLRKFKFDTEGDDTVLRAVGECCHLLEELIM